MYKTDLTYLTVSDVRAVIYVRAELKLYVVDFVHAAVAQSLFLMLQT